MGNLGALGALLSTFTILAVAGSALRVAVAREIALGAVGSPAAMGAATRRWLSRLGIAGVALTAHASIDWDWELPALTLVAAVLAGVPLARGYDRAPG